MVEKTPGEPPAENEAGVETEAQTESRNEILEGMSDLQRAAEDRDRETDKFFVVGIGASAGGLEALGELVKHVPMDNMAFVVVQHLAPHHDSVLTQLLSRTSKVQVQTATDGTHAEPNHVYVIPPNTDLALLHGVLRLIPPKSGDHPRLPIDYFFRSLAQDKGASAIGIILSGTGTDGTLGLRAIKEGGGLAFVQEPSTANSSEERRRNSSRLSRTWNSAWPKPRICVDTRCEAGSRFRGRLPRWRPRRPAAIAVPV